MIKLKLNICFSDTNMNRTVFAQWCWIWGANLAVVFELGPDLPGNVQAMAKVIPDVPTPERSKATPAVKKIAYKTARWGSCLFKNHHQRLWVGHEDTYVWPRLFCSILKASESWKQMIGWIFGCQSLLPLTWLWAPRNQNSPDTLAIFCDGIKTLYMAATKVKQRG